MYVHNKNQNDRKKYLAEKQQKSNLKSQVEKVHDKEKLYQCALCECQFNTQPGYQYHMKTKHNEKVHESKKPDKEVMSTTPVVNFGSQDGASTSTASYDCSENLCLFYFTAEKNQSDYEEHLFTVHGKKREKKNQEENPITDSSGVHESKEPDNEVINTTPVENFGSQDGASTSAASFDSHLNGKSNKKNTGVFNPNDHNKNQIERKRSLRSHTETVHERKKPNSEVMNANRGMTQL